MTATTIERRPFKSIEQISSNCVTRPETKRGNPNSVEAIPTKRDFKSLVHVGSESDDDPAFVTTRYIDTDGTELWHKNHGATVHGVAIDADGNVYECGERFNSVTLRKRDAAGRKLWTRDHGATLKCCAICPDGIVVGGEPGTGGATIRKYLADGTLAWSYTTAAGVIEIAADSTGRVAALDGPTNPWDRGLYALTSAGSLTCVNYHGYYVSGSSYSWIAGLAFYGASDGNTGAFADPFSYYQNVHLFRVDLGEVTMNAGFVYGTSDGYPTATYGTGLGDIFSHSSGVTPTSFPPAFTPVHRSTFRGLNTFVRATDNGTYANTSSSDDFSDQLGSGLGLCSQPGLIWTAGTSLRRYSLVSPPPVSYPNREWNSLPDWTAPHGGTIYSCDANAAGISVLGGAKVPA